MSTWHTENSGHFNSQSSQFVGNSVTNNLHLNNYFHFYTNHFRTTDTSGPTGSNNEEREYYRAFGTTFYETHKNRIPLRSPETCQWILSHPNFCAWRSNPKSTLLWISAGPGCGKSVLCRALIDEEGRSSGGRNTICYFFFEDNDEQNGLVTALCALLHQLFASKPYLLRHAVRLWSNNGPQFHEEVQKMWCLFRAAAIDKDAGPVFCILDGLDECKDTDRRTLIKLLCDLHRNRYDGHAAGALKFLVTSRPTDDVQRCFEQTMNIWPSICIRGEDENDHIQQEIDGLVDRLMRNLTNSYGLTFHLAYEIDRQLRVRQHRTYIWFHLIEEQLHRMGRADMLRQEGQAVCLPTSLDDAYDRILSQIEVGHNRLALRVFSIIIGARRPLGREEMALALSAARASEQNENTLNVSQARIPMGQMLNQCGIFVATYDSKLFFIHRTAKEFLLAQTPNRSQQPHSWRSCLRENQVELEMAKICVRYMHLFYERQPEPEDYYRIPFNMTRSSPSRSLPSECYEMFWRYCAQNWTLHLRDHFLPQDDRLLLQALSLFATDGPLFPLWFPFMWQVIRPHEEIPILHDSHVMAMTGHSSALLELYQGSGSMVLHNRDGNDHTAIYWAASCGHETVVEHLLDWGALPSTRALVAALRNNHLRIAEILLDHGAIIDHHTLRPTVRSGQVRTVEWLLSHGAVADSLTLRVAVWRGHAKIVKLLLQYGTTPDEDCRRIASVGGDKDIIRMLEKWMAHRRIVTTQ